MASHHSASSLASLESAADLPPPQYSECADCCEWPGTRALSRSSSTNSMESCEFADGDRPPRYSAAVTMRGELAVKQELATPFRKSRRRPWRQAEVEIDNTQLRIKTFVGSIFATRQSYTLQFAEVGLASDYTKKEHNIRLRVEARQYLLHCGSRQNMLRWFLALQMAICLALPLELRTLPEDSRRRRNKLRDRERRERRERLRDELEAQGTVADVAAAAPAGAAPEPPRAARRARSRADRHRQSDAKWQPRTRQSRFSEKDFPHLPRDATWQGKDVLYRGRWALVSNHHIVYLATH